MKLNSIVFFLLLVKCITASLPANGQEHKYEIGTMLGTSFYMGDANRTRLFLNSRPAAGIIYRYNVNFHWAIRTNFKGGSMAVNSANAKNVFPWDNDISFKRTFFDLGGQVEYNFYPFSDTYSYLNTRLFTPYLLTGVGVTMAMKEPLFLGLNVPVGIGVKYKIREKLNAGFEFSLHKLFRDDIDMLSSHVEGSLDAPFGIKSNFLKNQDWYAFSMIFLTWDFGKRYNPCCD